MGEVAVSKKTVFTTDAPAAIGPYSQGISAGSFLFISGQLPADPKTGELVEGGIGARTDRILRNIEEILKSAGSGLERVVKTTVFLTDMADFQVFNKAYAEYFKEAPPARSTIQVAALPKGSNIEIEAIAYLGY